MIRVFFHVTNTVPEKTCLEEAFKRKIWFLSHHIVNLLLHLLLNSRSDVLERKRKIKPLQQHVVVHSNIFFFSKVFPLFTVVTSDVLVQLFFVICYISDVNINMQSCVTPTIWSPVFSTCLSLCLSWRVMFITYWGRWRRLQGTERKDDNMSWAAKNQGVSSSTFSVFASLVFLFLFFNRDLRK